MKNSTKNGFASASSFAVSAHSFEKFKARSLISFQLNAMLFYRIIVVCRARYSTRSGSDLVNLNSYQVATAPRTVPLALLFLK